MSKSCGIPMRSPPRGGSGQQVQVLTSGSPGRDEYGWLANRWAAAISSGTMVFPKGAYHISGGFTIPKGKSMTIQGAGKDQTILRCWDDGLASGAVAPRKLFTTQKPSYDPAGWGTLSGYPSGTIQAAPAGATTLTLASGSFTTPGWYVLASAESTVVKTAGTTIKSKGEMVRVLSWSGGVATLERGTKKAYDAGDAIYDCTQDVIPNLTIEGITFDGRRWVSGSPRSNPQLHGTEWAQHFWNGAFVANLTIRNCRFMYSSSWSFDTRMAYNVTFENVSCDFLPSSATGGPSAANWDHCSKVVVTDFTCDQNGMGWIGQSATPNVKIHAGIGEVSMTRVGWPNGIPYDKSDGVDRGFKIDDHGMGSQNITLIDCGTDGINLGNNQWLRGPKNVYIKNCNPTTIWIGTNTQNVLIEDCTFTFYGSDFTAQAVAPPYAVPEPDYATGITFRRCTFLGRNNDYTFSLMIGRNVVFEDCTIYGGPGYGRFHQPSFNNVSFPDNWTFRRCRFIPQNASCKLQCNFASGWSIYFDQWNEIGNATSADISGFFSTYSGGLNAGTVTVNSGAVLKVYTNVAFTLVEEPNATLVNNGSIAVYNRSQYPQ
jgi:hypothetical protein